MAARSLIEAIARQERDLTFPRFRAADAFEIGSRVASQAQAANLPIVIDIGFFHQRLFFASMEGATPDNIDWARRKTNVVERFGRSSYGVGLMMAEKQTSLEQRYGLPRSDFAEHGGAFPVHVNGCGVIGYITVSGLPQQDDHMLIVRHVCDFLGKDISGYGMIPE